MISIYSENTYYELGKIITRIPLKDDTIFVKFDNEIYSFLGIKNLNKEEIYSLRENDNQEGYLKIPKEEIYSLFYKYNFNHEIRVQFVFKNKQKGNKCCYDVILDARKDNFRREENISKFRSEFNIFKLAFKSNEVKLSIGLGLIFGVYFLSMSDQIKETNVREFIKEITQVKFSYLFFIFLGFLIIAFTLLNYIKGKRHSISYVAGMLAITTLTMYFIAYKLHIVNSDLILMILMILASCFIFYYAFILIEIIVKWTNEDNNIGANVAKITIIWAIAWAIFKFIFTERR